MTALLLVEFFKI